MKVILGKCKGGDVEIIDFFSIDCERSMIYIHFPSRGLLTCKSQHSGKEEAPWY